MIFNRNIALSKNNSFFLLGPRGVGKSTYITNEFLSNIKSSSVVSIDLLLPNIEYKYASNPNILYEELIKNNKCKWCFIDEFQKIPEILNIVHLLIEKTKIKFILTGSSVRKLKKGRGNLLAGRAFDFKMHPLTSFEINDKFNLNKVLRWGSLPKVFSYTNNIDKQRFLQSYISLYIKEEIQLEQIIRNLNRFRQFLPFASQMNSKILNFSKISRLSGVDPKSISRYFEILIDTLLGFNLEPFYTSVRKQQKLKPKFYLFDTGISCELRPDFDGNLSKSTSFYGEIFEQFFILECIRLNDYFEKRDSFSYFQDKDGAEIDLIIQRKGIKPILIEIKSSTKIIKDHGKHLQKLSKNINYSRKIIVSQEKTPRILDNGIEVVPWLDVLKELYYK